MKIQTKSQTDGSVLLVSLLTAGVIGIALGSYLTLTANQHQSVFRSMTWNEGIPVSEAGIEEALTQIHYYGITNFSANWTWGTDGCYHKKRFIGTDGAYYDVAVKLGRRLRKIRTRLGTVREQVDRGLKPEAFARLWLHTHPANSAEPSGPRQPLRPSFDW